jgi:hypothetical protein
MTFCKFVILSEVKRNERSEVKRNERSEAKRNRIEGSP